MRKLVLLFPMLACAAPVSASTPAAWVQNDRMSELACLKASSFRDARISPLPLRFSDRLGVDARLVTGTYAAGARKQGMMVCLYHRRGGFAELVDADSWLAKPR
jgi:hypothetical protein